MQEAAWPRLAVAYRSVQSRDLRLVGVGERAYFGVSSCRACCLLCARRAASLRAGGEARWRRPESHWSRCWRSPAGHDLGAVSAGGQPPSPTHSARSATAVLFAWGSGPFLLLGRRQIPRPGTASPIAGARWWACHAGTYSGPDASKDSSRPTPRCANPRIRNAEARSSCSPYEPVGAGDIAGARWRLRAG